MKKHRVHLPAPGTIIAVLALIVAMAGTAYAANRIRANSVGANKLKTITVRTVPSAAFGGQAGNNAIPAHKTVTVICAPGEVALSGGLDWNVDPASAQSALYTTEVVPVLTNGEPTGYAVTGASDENPFPGQTILFTAYAECLVK